MRNSKTGFAKVLAAPALMAVIALGVATLAAGPAEARRPPGPLCGPTILFECTLRDGSTQLVGLTRCEVEKYEKKNKATCVPATF